MIPTTNLGLDGAALAGLLGWSLKATAALALAALATALLARRSASLRHLVWTAAVAAVLGLPLAALVAPEWRVAPATAPGAFERVAPAPTHEIVLTDEHGAATTITEQTDVQALRDLVASGASLEATVRQASDTTNPNPPPIPLAVRWPTALLAAWALGTLAVAGFFVIGHAVVRGIAVGATPAGAAWGDVAFEAARRIGVTKPFELLRCESGVLPMSLGVFRPRILLPAAASSWPEERLMLVIMHELAHVRRRDCLTQALAQLACAILWFNPVVWYAAHRMQVERERACDDEVLRANTLPSQYADHLVEVVRSLRAPRVTALGAVSFARGSQLEGRVLAVLRPGLDRARVSPATAGRVIGIALLALAPLAALAPAASSGGSEARAERAARDDHRAARDFDRKALPSRILRAPTDGSLADRVDWVQRQTGEGEAYWIGYVIDESAHNDGGVMGDTGEFDLKDLDSPHKLRDVLGSMSPEARDEGAMAFLIHGVEKNGVLRVDRLRFQTLGMPAGFEGEPLYWMGRAEQAQSIELLTPLLRAKHAGVRKETAIALGYHTESEVVVPVLAKVIDEPEYEEEVKIGALHGLGVQKGDAAVRVLTRVAKSDAPDELRREAIEALGQTAEKAAFEVLRELAHLPGLVDHVGESVREALGDLAENRVALEAMKDSETLHYPDTPETPEPPDPEWTPAPMPGAAVSPYETPTPPPTPATAPVPPGVRFSDGTKVKAPKAHKSEKNAKGPHSLRSLDDADVEVQRQAVESLGRQPESVALPELMRIAERHPNPDVQRQAVMSIGQLGSPAALAVLEKYAWRHPDGDVQREAIHLMGRFESSFDRLHDVARKHPEVESRRFAVESLGRFEGERSRRALENIVRRDPSEDVQRQAVETLGRRDDASIEQLADIARRHPSATVRRQAVEMIGRHDSDEALRALEDLIEGK
jgi:beta-lactamase regulating signal transducer with metallopeptidase domain/HEAT repeat protein